MTKKEGEKNYYKITTFVLIGIFILVGIGFLFNYYSDSKFEQGAVYGQEVMFAQIVNTVAKEGYVTFTINNATMTLVPSEMLEIQKEQIVLQIMEEVEKNGGIEIYNNETRMLLIKQEIPEQ